MSSMINYGIDLGTSNSLIARFNKGDVEVFKNPNGFKETLPSVVGFRKDTVLIGERARTYLERDPMNVVSRFKRKMGTSETFKIKSLDSSKSPVELSAYVLKELKTFVHSGEQVDTAVITIPASFDTVQSNATKEAGLQAGFQSVILLQEPIAASLAYANKEKNVDLKNSQWLVYDLGGGTFDVALVRILEGELTVLDHEGDNYLGGSDFDALIVEKMIVPELERRGRFENLLAQMKSGSGRYNKLWYVLLNKAEEAKVELSTRTAAEIDLGGIQVEDDDGRQIESIISVTRSDFESVIKAAIDGTVDMMKRMLMRNSLQPSDLKFVLMVGGSTYIPNVRRRVEEAMGISVNTSIDPTNAIAVGAAYFAGTKEKGRQKLPAQSTESPALKIRAVYNKTSQEQVETFAARVEGAVEGMQYRITSVDGSYDSGLKRLSARIVEDLPLREGAYNIFDLKVVDGRGNPVQGEFDSIQIAQGRYSVAGQMLPEDICLVKDDLGAKDTKLIQIFSKNSVLPTTRGKHLAEVARTIVKGSSEEIRLVVVEGSSGKHSSTNKPIGVLSISGLQISRDLLKGTEIDLTFEMSESRDLSISAYLNGTGQEFSQVFKPSQRNVSARLLASEIQMLEAKLQEEMADAKKAGNSKTETGLGKVLDGVQALYLEGSSLFEDDVTDKKFQLEDKKRRLAQEMFELTSGKRLEQAKSAYKEARATTGQIVKESGNDREKHTLSEIIAREHVFISSSSPEKIQSEVELLDNIRFKILFRTPDFLVGMYQHLVERRAAMNDQMQAKQLIDGAKRAIESGDWDEVRLINGRLWDLMPAEQQASEEMQIYTGIV